MLEQREHAVADQVGCCLVPREEEHDALSKQLVMGEHTAFSLRLDKTLKEGIVDPLAFMPANKLPDIRRELNQRTVRLAHCVGCPGEAAGDRIRPDLERSQVLGRYAQ